MAQSHTQWTSRLAFILAATGAAVGLGNIWRFPYIAAENGGSAFVLLYLLFIAVIGIPLLIAEISLGRTAKQAPVNALATLGRRYGRTRHWSLLGWWGALALLLILSFYSVVSGWSLAYLFKTLGGHFHHITPAQSAATWSTFMNSPWQLLGWHTLFMALTVAILMAGVTHGIETATRFMMPALYIIMFLLLFYALTTGDAKQAWHYLFHFNPHQITGGVVINAMGQAFFSLALGAGAMLMYGAYVPDSVNIGKTVIIVALLDVLVALLSGLTIFPLVFAHHLPTDSGPGLMFVTLPIIFSPLSHGTLLGVLFFLLLIFAAWTSSINLAEPLLVIVQERWGVSRSSAALIIGALAWLLGVLSALSFNVLKGMTFLGHQTFFDLASNIPMNIILPIGGLGFAVFAGWVLPDSIQRSLFNRTVTYTVWRFLIRYLVPVAIVMIFIQAIS